MRRSRPHAVLTIVGRQCPLWIIRVDFGVSQPVRYAGDLGNAGLYLDCRCREKGSRLGTIALSDVTNWIRP
jgi:hypothetical protein